MAVVRELITKIGFDVQEGPLHKAENLIEKLKFGLEGLLAALAVEKLFEFFKGAAEQFTQIEKGSQRLGVSAENFQKIAYAAKLSDIGVEQFTQTMGIFSKKIVGFQENSKEAVETFKKVGVDPRKYKDQIEVLTAVSEKISKMENGAKKTSLSMDLFGKSGGALVPFLNKGGDAIAGMFQEAEDLNLIISEESIKAGAKFGDNINKIYSFGKGMSFSFAAQLFPYLNDITDMILSWAKKNTKFIGGRIADGVLFFRSAFLTLKAVFVLIGDALVGLGRLFTWFQSILGLSDGAVRGLKLALIALSIVIASLFSPITAIIAIIAGIALIYDDVKHYIDGKPSILGEVIKWLETAWPGVIQFLKDWWEGKFVDWLITTGNKLMDGLSKIFDSIGESIAKAFTAGPIHEFIKALQEAYNWVVDVDTKLKQSWLSKVPGMGNMPLFQKIGDQSPEAQAQAAAMQNQSIQSSVLPTPIALESAQKIIDAIQASKPQNMLSNASAMLGPLTPAQAAGSSVQNTNIQNTQNSVKVDVTVNGGDTPVDIAQNIASGIKNTLDDMFRAGQRSLQSGAIN